MQIVMLIRLTHYTSARASHATATRKLLVHRCCTRYVARPWAGMLAALSFGDPRQREAV
jgi:hypothetical protein